MANDINKWITFMLHVKLHNFFLESSVQFITFLYFYQYHFFARYFVFDQDRFPNPEDMLIKVATTGRKMVCSVDPHLKEDDNYYVYREAKQLGFFVKDRDGKDFKGFCWPGSNTCIFESFTHTACRA